MNVFLTGATGYIGSVVAEYLLKTGNTVTGYARSAASAEKLTAAGIEPAHQLEDAKNTDAVIHLAAQFGPQMAQVDEHAVRTLIAALRGSGKPFVYTSGAWVLGPTRGHVAGEMAPVRPPQVVAWRPAIEKLALAAVEEKVRASVIRPTMVYGRAGGVIGKFVHDAREFGVVRIVGGGANHWSFVHVDALAELYLLAIRQQPSGEIFLAADGPAFTVRTVADTVATMYETKVELILMDDARASLGPIADAMVMDQKIMSTKAGRMLGWAPRWPSVLDDIRSGSYAPAS
ncbi:MAG: NAD-dependent epimerase/dehydratase family protein [Bryobacterales bacterium]|nr:NAD-dependent epimerase/dehydratase family protein [Bryobacterales bacterium]